MKNLFLIIIFISGILFFHGNTFAQSNSISPKPVGQDNAHQKKTVIAIYPFTTSGSYDYGYAESAGNAIEAGFVHSKRFTVVERSQFGILNDEDRFKEVNTSEAVKRAAKLGADILVIGHVITVSNGIESTNPLLPSLKSVGVNISLDFKLINVETGEIITSETILGKGNGSTSAEAMGNSYKDIAAQARDQVAAYLPQRFTFEEAVETDKKQRLKTFKIWGGSSQGLKKGDIIDIYQIHYITDPKGKKIEEKKLPGTARITEINSTETATCELQQHNSIGGKLLTDLKENPQTIAFEYQGTVKKGLFFK